MTAYEYLEDSETICATCYEAEGRPSHFHATGFPVSEYCALCFQAVDPEARVSAITGQIIRERDY